MTADGYGSVVTAGIPQVRAELSCVSMLARTAMITSGVADTGGRGYGDRRVSTLLRLPGLRDHAAPQAWRLLRVLLLRRHCVPSRSGTASAIAAMTAARIVEDTPEQPPPGQCWCCGRVDDPSLMVHLGNHPEVALCRGCARWAADQRGR